MIRLIFWIGLTILTIPSLAYLAVVSITEGRYWMLPTMLLLPRLLIWNIGSEFRLYHDRKRYDREVPQ